MLPILGPTPYRGGGPRVCVTAPPRRGWGDYKVWEGDDDSALWARPVHFLRQAEGDKRRLSSLPPQPPSRAGSGSHLPWPQGQRVGVCTFVDARARYLASARNPRWSLSHPRFPTHNPPSREGAGGPGAPSRARWRARGSEAAPAASRGRGLGGARCLAQGAGRRDVSGRPGCTVAVAAAAAAAVVAAALAAPGGISSNSSSPEEGEPAAVAAGRKSGGT